MEKIRKGESQKREDAGARKGRKVAKKMQVREKVGKSRSTMFSWLRRVEKVGSLKRRVQRQLAR